MAKELSQGELLDFLCQSGGRVANAALLGHFRRFLRDPAAPPELLQRRRHLFKGFVNSVATVKQEGPAKYVVLRRRYRELVGEDAVAKPARESLDGPAEVAPGKREEEEEEEQGGEPRPGSRTCPGEAQQRLAGGPKDGAAASPPRHDRPPSPGAPPSPGLQQRVRAWIASAPEVGPPAPPPDCALEEGGPPWPGRPSALEWREPPPVFRSIRCQLSLQDLDEFLEQESPASEDSSGSGGSCSSSDSYRAEGESGPPPQPPPGGPSGCARSPQGLGQARVEKGLPRKPQANGVVGPAARARGPPPGAPILGRLALPGPIARGSSSEEELVDKDSQRPSGLLPTRRKPARLPPPNLDAPLSLHLAPRQGPQNSTLAVEGPTLHTDGSPEHRSSLVPLEPREHAWLVKVATGSWLQVRALFLEDPYLATRKDFISGFTVLHWLAKHGNAQVLLDFVAGAQRAGVVLDVNVKSGCGYTPLHLAAMHGHQLVIRLLVQRLRCRVQVRDSSGKRPWQYLNSSTSGEIWQLLGAPKGKTIFPAHPIARNSSLAQRGRSPELARKISRKTSLAAYLKPQHVKWKMANKFPALHEREEYSD